MAVMNRTTRPLLPPLAAFLLAALCLLSPRPADALSVSKSLPLYARDMEFYYQNKRPEVLPGILRSFDGQGVLAQGEKRLMVAAFLAEVLRDDPSARSLLLPPQDGLSQDGRRTLAWVAHLAGLPDETALLGELLSPDDAPLLAQIQSSPASLARWDIYAEKSVLQMYWAAFLASPERSVFSGLRGGRRLALRTGTAPCRGARPPGAGPSGADRTGGRHPTDYSAPTAARRFLTRFPFAPLLLPSRDLYGGEGVSP